MSEPEPPKPRVPIWRYVVAIILAPVVFMLAILPLAIFGQVFNDIPNRQAFVPILAEVAIGSAATIYVLRGVIRPKP